MAIDTCDFLWQVCEEGYQWKQYRYFRDGINHKTTMADLSGPEWVLTIGKKLGEQYLAKQSDPLKLHPSLFRTFGDLPVDDRDAMLAFANKYGLLGEQKALYQERECDPHALEPIWGERLSDWNRAIHDMKEALEIWDWIQERNTEKLSHHIIWVDEQFNEEGVRLRSQGWVYVSHPGVPMSNSTPGWHQEIIESSHNLFKKHDVYLPALFLVQKWINKHLEGKTQPQLLYHLEHGKQMLFNVPKTLLSAMWLQFAQTVAANKKYRQCKACGKWFEISKNKDARTERRLFCSHSCKTREYRQRMEKAHLLKSEGKSAKAIANELKTDETTIKAWIKRKK